MKQFFVFALLVCLCPVPTTSTALLLPQNADVSVPTSEKTYKDHHHHHGYGRLGDKHRPCDGLKAFIEKTFAVIDACDPAELGKLLSPTFRTLKADGTAADKEQSLKEYDVSSCQQFGAEEPIRVTTEIKEYLEVSRNVAFVRVDNGIRQYAQAFHVVEVAHGAYQIQNVMTTAVYGEAAQAESV